MLKTNTTAPNFKAINQHGEPFELNQLAGKNIVLFFYPKDDTPGCTAAACSLRDNYSTLQELGYEVVGVSKDPVRKHLKFVEKYDLPYTLISDESTEINQKYEVWSEKKFMGRAYMGTVRSTFIIDTKQKIKHIINEVNTAEHGAQVLEIIKS
jgi:peroxiredoxin Q/BCP